VPAGGDICVAQRFYDIPPPIIAVNAIAHQAIAQYTATNKVTNSPWAYYKLVNVQADPFDKSQIVNDPTSIHNAATFFQANSVVETDYTLQNFNGRSPVNGAPTDYTTGTRRSSASRTSIFSSRWCRPMSPSTWVDAWAATASPSRSIPISASSSRETRCVAPRHRPSPPQRRSPGNTCFVRAALSPQPA
jgi:hypothetical protein